METTEELIQKMFHVVNCMYITFSKTFDNKGNLLTGLLFVLSVVSFFLWAGTMLVNFKESGNLLLFIASLLKINYS